MQLDKGERMGQDVQVMAQVLRRKAEEASHWEPTWETVTDIPASSDAPWGQVG